MADLPDNPAVDPSGLLAEIERLKAELLEAKWQIAELEARADVDPLTDILNRRGFDRELLRSLAYVKRYGAPATLVLIDLDGFKAVNDSHGHATGDALLKAVARQLVSRVRASDIVARLGGGAAAARHRHGCVWGRCERARGVVCACCVAKNKLVPRALPRRLRAPLPPN